MTIWLTADLHIGHFNIIRYCDRPFDDLEEMHELIVSRWNECVEESDVVYILGDLGFVKRDGSIISQTLSRLKGEKHLIRGNHDKADTKWYIDNGISTVSDHYIIFKGSMLSHYPLAQDRFDGKRMIRIKKILREIYQKERCIFHYFAHTHKPPISGSDFMNVGVDLHDFYPIEY